jgi:NTE family protein
MLAVQAQLNSLYMNNILKATYAFHNLAHHAEIIAIVPEFEKPLGMFDTDQLPYIIAEGERGAQEHLPYLERLWHRK